MVSMGRFKCCRLNHLFEECLDVLISSLDQAPLEKIHTPALFYLAETTLYWLRTEALHQPYLRTGELKLLRMGQLVFTRLFYHHMAGQLQGQNEFKNRLFTYLDGQCPLLVNRIFYNVSFGKHHVEKWH